MKRLVLFVTLFALLFAVRSARADNSYQGQPAPESADQIITGFDQPELEGEVTTPTAFDEILKKSSLKLKLRNYYLNRSRPNNTDPLGWAQGGSVEYKVDKIADVFGFNAEYFGSYKLYAPDDKDGTLLLEPGQNNIDSLGVLNPRLNFNGNIVSAYRQRIDLPYVNSQDNRMIPNTFQAYTLAMPKAENDKFQYVIGYIDAMKKRNSETFSNMALAAGVDRDRGMVLGGARYYFMPDLSLGAAEFYVPDIVNIVYAETVHKKKFDDNLANTASFQFSDERSVGSDYLRDESFSTNAWGLQDAISYNYATLKAAFTADDSGGDIRSPYGSYPGYNSVIVEDFNRAGEKSWQLGLSYNFARFGFKEAGISTAFVHGFDAIDENTKADLPDKNETDVTLDYKWADGALNGLWLRLRGAFIDEDGRGTTEDYRIIVNYELPIFKPEEDAKATT